MRVHIRTKRVKQQDVWMSFEQRKFFFNIKDHRILVLILIWFSVKKESWKEMGGEKNTYFDLE